MVLCCKGGGNREVRGIKGKGKRMWKEKEERNWMLFKIVRPFSLSRIFREWLPTLETHVGGESSTSSPTLTVSLDPCDAPYPFPPAITNPISSPSNPNPLLHPIPNLSSQIHSANLLLENRSGDLRRLFPKSDRRNVRLVGNTRKGARDESISQRF